MHTFIRIPLHELKWADDIIKKNPKCAETDVFLIGTYGNRVAEGYDYKDGIQGFRVLCYAKQMHIAIDLVSRLNGGLSTETNPIYYSSIDTLMKSYNIKPPAEDDKPAHQPDVWDELSDKDKKAILNRLRRDSEM